jgi:hypothetical protein
MFAFPVKLVVAYYSKVSYKIIPVQVKWIIKKKKKHLTFISI